MLCSQSHPPLIARATLETGPFQIKLETHQLRVAMRNDEKSHDCCFTPIARTRGKAEGTLVTSPALQPLVVPVSACSGVPAQTHPPVSRGPGVSERGEGGGALRQKTPPQIHPDWGRARRCPSSTAGRRGLPSLVLQFVPHTVSQGMGDSGKRPPNGT